MKQLFINRELSWLAFNRRVLLESAAEQTPAFERLKFIAIFESNLDEFFMIRMGSLHDRALLKTDVPDNKTGMSSKEQIRASLAAVKPLYKQASECFKSVLSALEAQGVTRVGSRDLDKKDRAYLKGFFQRQILPLLSPQIVDSRHPFPHLENKVLYVTAELRSENGKPCLGLIPVSSVLPRIVYLPSEDGKIRFLFCEDLIRRNLNRIFQAYRVKSSSVARVTRNADIDVEESFSDEEEDWRDYMKEILKKRERLSPVRLEFRAGASRAITNYLQEKLALDDEHTFFLHLPLDLGCIYELESHFSQAQKAALLHKPLLPSWPQTIAQGKSVTEQAQARDLFLFYPYDSMKPFLTLLHEAANDPDTVSIKITLYRLSHSSQVVQTLCEAAENGKDVTVLLELKARFDEENNILLSQTLEEAGCKILYGLEGFKVHSKTTLITRRTKDGIKLICHIGTGNYNEKTARLYSDVSYITANPVICEEVVTYFHNLTTNNPKAEYEHLLVAPMSFKSRILALMDGEIEKARKHEPCGMKLKMNSLTDKEIILKLIEASRAGVPIRMIIRGICCLRPGVLYQTDNIEIRSIVGRYLEHSRIFVFGTGKNRQVFISSADFMTRNTQRRVEVASPIYDREIADKLEAIIDLELDDNQKSHRLLSNGSYEKITNDKPPLDSQIAFFDAKQLQK